MPAAEFDGTIGDMADNLGVSSRNALRAGYLIGLAGAVILVAGLLLRLDAVTRFGITFVTVGLGMTLAGAAFGRTARSLDQELRNRSLSSEVKLPGSKTGKATGPERGERGGSGWLDRLIGRTDVSRILDYEIGQRQKSTKRDTSSGLDADNPDRRE